jgi:sugar phosphate isomerase/epimerase
MKRREFIQLGTGAVVGGVLVPAALGARPQGGTAQAPAAAASGGPVTKLKVDIYSRHLQWLRTADEVADAALEMGYEGVNVTVRTYPGHVNPEKVAQELPPFVKTLRNRGLLVRQITTNISDVDSPHAEAIVATAGSIGITHFWWGTYRYEAGKPIYAQLDALRPRVAKIAALSEKHKVTASYHTYSMPNTVGSAMWDLLYLLREHDPRFVGFHYDTGHEAHHINGLWEVNMKAAGPYVAAVAVKDYMPTQEAGGGRGGGARGGGAAPGGRADTPPAAPAAPVAPPDPTLIGNNWRTRTVPLGAGMVNLAQVAAVLKEIGFAGPLEIQAEYPNGGAESAQDTLTLPRAQVLDAMKKDLLTLRRGFAASGLL